MTDDNRILLLGDVHGDGRWLSSVIDVASVLKIDRILQLGDMGYWPHYNSGRRFLKNAKEDLDRTGIEMWWIPGNHENWDMLNELPLDEDGLHRDGSLVYISRGARWTWGGRTFLGCGGAYSIDKPWRIEGESWWAGETITEADILRCGDSHADVLVTHDAPWGAQNVMGPMTAGDKDSYPESMANRKRVAAICDATIPFLNVHAHYHHRNSTNYHSTRVEGFGRDTDWKGASGILDLDTLEVTSVDMYSIWRKMIEKSR